mmetsp:Transcript_100825/g.162651  ORF Transcript_100825/g.162651 Transcript_100825/m.162651 type:complete len:292 (+) Transcript_100825:39-914(+)
MVYDSMPIADMGKFQELLQRRAAQGASPLRDALLDHDEILRRNRSSFGNPFRKGDKGLGCLASDEIEAEAEATHGAAVGKQPDRRRRRAPSAANRRVGVGGGKAAGGKQPDPSSQFSPSPSPSPSSSPNISPAPSREHSPPFGHDRDDASQSTRPFIAPTTAPGGTAIDQQEGHRGSTSVEVYMGSQAGAFDSPTSTASNMSPTNNLTLQVTQRNGASVKLHMMRLLKKPNTAHSTRRFVQKAKGLRGEVELVKRLLGQLASFANEWRNKEVAIALLALSQSLASATSLSQ